MDHLADYIEEFREESPTFDFEKAKERSFNKFGVFGFMEIYEGKQKQMGKKYRKIMWSFIKEWFRLPKIILTSAMVLLCYTVFRIPIIGQYVFYSIYLFGFVVVFIKLWQFRKRRKQQEDNKSKRWLLEDTIFYLVSSNMMILLANIYYIFALPKFFVSINCSLIAAFCSVILGLFIYVTIFLIPSKSEMYLKKEYPEYVFKIK